MDFQLPPGQSFPPEVLAEILISDYYNFAPSKSVYRVLTELARRRFDRFLRDPDFLLDPENYIFQLLLDGQVSEAIYLLRPLPEPIPYIRLYRIALVRGYLAVLNLFPNYTSEEVVDSQYI